MQHKKQQKVFVWKNKDMLQRLIIFWRCMLHSTRFICDNMTSFLKTNDNFRTYLHFLSGSCIRTKKCLCQKAFTPISLHLFFPSLEIFLRKFFCRNCFPRFFRVSDNSAKTETFIHTFTLRGSADWHRRLILTKSFIWDNSSDFAKWWQLRNWRQYPCQTGWVLDRWIWKVAPKVISSLLPCFPSSYFFASFTHHYQTMALMKLLLSFSQQLIVFFPSNGGTKQYERGVGPKDRTYFLDMLLKCVFSSPAFRLQNDNGMHCI